MLACSKSPNTCGGITCSEKKERKENAIHDDQHQALRLSPAWLAGLIGGHGHGPVLLTRKSSTDSQVTPG